MLLSQSRLEDRLRFVPLQSAKLLRLGTDLDGREGEGRNGRLYMRFVFRKPVGEGKCKQDDMCRVLVFYQGVGF